MNYFKLNEQNYPMTYQGKAPLDDTWQEFTVEDGVYSPVELNDAILAQTAKEDIDNQISEAKKYLADTDWVVVKINEASIQGQDTASLLTKYADILSERENKRLTINQLQI